MKYLHEFVSKLDFLKKYFGDDYLQPWASLTTSNYQSDYNLNRKKLIKTPLTTIPLVDVSTKFTFYIGKDVNTDTLESISYSVDGGETGTTTANIDATAVSIPVTVTNKTPVMGKGVGNALGVSDTVFSYLRSNGDYEILGNPLSLLGEQYNLKSLKNTSYALSHLFSNDSNLRYADRLILSVKECGQYCYGKMFNGCTRLETFPKLEAIKLAGHCYGGMFYNCDKMITPVELPSIKLATYCYEHMFDGCNGLTSIPELPATNLYQYCYQYMFQSCTGLVDCEINLPATAMASYCYQYMFNGCTNLTTVPELPSMSIAPYCYAHMFQNCKAFTTTPELPATVVEQYCYSYMFSGCTGLTSAPNLLATTLKPYCYEYMFNGCTGLTTMPSMQATTLASYCCRYMFQNCTGITTTPVLPATTSATYCYQYMFRGCTGLTTMPTINLTNMTAGMLFGMFRQCTNLVNVASILPGTTLSNYCFKEMFYGCTSLTQAPILPAVTATATQCYHTMFYGCSNLSNITALFTNNPNSAGNAQLNGVSGVASTGTFTKSADAEGDPESYRSVSGVPVGGDVVTQASE